MPLGAGSTPEEMMRRIQESMTPATQTVAEGRQLLNQTFSRFATSADPEANAVDSEMTRKHGLGWRTLDATMLVLQEISRPQKALFAGFNTWQRGGSLSQAWDVTQDEYMWGWGSGNFRRDVTGQDLIDPDKTHAAESLFSLRGGIGFVLDVVVDPANLIPVAPVVKALGRGGGRIARMVGTAADSTRLTKGVKDAVVDGWKKTFIVPKAVTDAGRAAQEAATRMDAYANEYREVILDDIITDNHAWTTLAEEGGFKSVDELGQFVSETARTTKIRDAGMGLAEPLNDTMARIYRDYGVDTYDRFMRTAGFRALRDEAPLRQAVFNSNFDKAMLAANRQFPAGVSDELKNVIFELKERDLERFVMETTKTVAPSGRVLPVFESMQKDYMMLSATREFRDLLGSMSIGRATKGAATSATDFSPFHVSELHSQLQEIGAEGANRLLRTESKEFPGLSEFVLVHPRSGARIHLPKMEKGGFHTDPRLIDATRQYYTDLAVNRSQVLGDLVDGYGKKLDEFMEVQVIDKSTGRQAVDRFGKPIFKTVQTFVRGAEVVNPAAVKSRTTQSIIGKFGHKLSEVEELTRLTPEAAYQLERDGLDILHNIPGFENVALPKEAADIVQNVTKWQSGSFDAVPGMKALSKLQNEVWKPLTLFPFPGYYFRNTVTNVFLQNNLGMSAAKDIVPYTARGTKILMAGSHPNAFRRIKDATTRVAGTGSGVKHRKLFEQATAHPSIVTRGVGDPTLAEKAIRLKDLVEGVTLDQLPNKDELGLLQLFTDLGVVRGGAYGSSEIFRSLEQAAETAVKHPLRRMAGLTVNTNPALAAGANMAMFAEDSQRVGAMLWMLEQGEDILTARDTIMRGMVDFNALTDIEKNVIRKYAIPFYSWARHATPLAAESFVMDNVKWRAMNKIIQQQEKTMVEHEQMLPDRMIPEYVARGLHVPVSRGDNGEYRFWLLDGWIPASQLTDIDSVDELLKAPLEQTGPVLKTLIELATQESLFLERDFAIGNRTYLGFRMPEWGITMLRNIRILNTADSLMKAEDSDDQQAELLRFLTGFNTVRVERGRAAMAYKSKVDKMRQKITSDIMNAAREGHREEIPGLVEQLKDFINEGR